MTRQASAVVLDERRVRRTAGERFQPHRAGSGEQVEHLGVVDGADQN